MRTLDEPSVSIIIVNYNGFRFLERCILSVMNSDYPNFEIIFVDNASTDNSVEFASKKFGTHQNFKIIRNNENVGPSLARNIGAKYAHGDYLVFLDADTFVDRHWLREIVNAMKSDLTIGACQSKIMDMENPTKLDSAGGSIDFLGFPFKYDDGQNDKGREIFVAKGTCVCFKKLVFEEIGGFDPFYFIYYEENDICWRVWLRGYRIVYVPRALVFHAGSRLAKGLPPNIRVFHSTKNSLITLLKNYELANLIKFVPLHVFFRLAEINMHLISGQPVFGLTKLKALLFVFFNLQKVLRQRSKVQYIIRKVSDVQIKRFFGYPNPMASYRYFKQLYKFQI